MPSVVPNDAVAMKSLKQQHGGSKGVKHDMRVPLSSISNDNGEKHPTKRDIIIFSDFDGTIFMNDTGHILFDSHGCGPKRREELDQEIKLGVRSFRDVSEELWGSLTVPFHAGFDFMKVSLEIDPDFHDFYDFCLARGIPFNVISAGLKPLLRASLDHFLGPEKSRHIDIIANDAHITPDGSQWRPIWRHDNHLGHDKAATIQEYRTTASSESEDGTCPLVIFVGDGVSDLPAAQEADLLFARKGLKLEEYCIEHHIPFIPFTTFADIKRELQKMVREDHKHPRGQERPSQSGIRPHKWRKVSNVTKTEVHGPIASSEDAISGGCGSNRPLLAFATPTSSISLGN